MPTGPSCILPFRPQWISVLLDISYMPWEKAVDPRQATTLQTYRSSVLGFFSQFLPVSQLILSWMSDQQTFLRSAS